MKHEPLDDPRFNDLSALEAESLDELQTPAPAPQSIEDARRAVRVELDMVWLKSVATDPAPPAASLRDLRKAVHSELGSTTASRNLQRQPTVFRRFRVWIPSSLAACLLFGVGSVFLTKDRTQDSHVQSDDIARVAAPLDREFQSDWLQLANLEASVDEVEHDLRRSSGFAPRRGVSDDFDRNIEELSDDLSDLEDLT